MKGKLRNAVVRIKSTEYSINKTNTDVLTLLVTLASSSYYVYKTTFLINAKLEIKLTVELQTTALSIETDMYACAIRIKNKFFSNLITVGHIPREISQHALFSSIKTEGGKVNVHVNSLTI